MRAQRRPKRPTKKCGVPRRKMSLTAQKWIEMGAADSRKGPPRPALDPKESPGVAPLTPGLPRRGPRGLQGEKTRIFGTPQNPLWDPGKLFLTPQERTWIGVPLLRSPGKATEAFRSRGVSKVEGAKRAQKVSKMSLCVGSRKPVF